MEEKGEIPWTPSYRRSIQVEVAGCFSSPAESFALALDLKQFWLQDAQSEPSRESSLALAVPFEGRATFKHSFTAAARFCSPN